MRTFIAVEVPEEIRNMVGVYIRTVAEVVRDVKWVAPENLHFTVKFLGEIDEKGAADVRGCIERVAVEHAPFTLGLAGAGFFPSGDRAKVIWIGADGGVDNLVDIFHDMEQHLEEYGFYRESKTFSPHLTIGRAKKDRNVRIHGGFPDFEPVGFPVTALALMKSTLTPDGPIYEKLYESSLNQRASGVFER